MAILHTEKFSKYAAGNNGYLDIENDNDDIVRFNNADGIIESANGRFGDNNLRTVDDGEYISFGLSAMSGTTIIVGMAVSFDLSTGAGGAASAPGNIEEILWCSPTAGLSTLAAMHWALCYDYMGHLYLQSSSGSLSTSTTLRVGIANNALKHNCWHWLEIKVSMLDSGSAEVRVDGVPVISVSGDFQITSATFSTLRMAGIQGSPTGPFSRFDDLIIMDGSGSAPFNDFIGDMRQEYQIPDADGAVTQWTPLSSTNESNIDDTLGNYDDDSSYISESTVDDVNLASHNNFSLTDATSIFYACLAALSRQETTGSELALRVVSDGTPEDGPDLTLTTAYKWKKHHFLVDPDTTAAWTLSGLNAAEWGVKHRN